MCVILLQFMLLMSETSTKDSTMFFLQTVKSSLHRVIYMQGSTYIHLTLCKLSNILWRTLDKARVTLQEKKAVFCQVALSQGSKATPRNNDGRGGEKTHHDWWAMQWRLTIHGWQQPGTQGLLATLNGYHTLGTSPKISTRVHTQETVCYSSIVNLLEVLSGSSSICDRGKKNCQQFTLKYPDAWLEMLPIFLPPHPIPPRCCSTCWVPSDCLLKHKNSYSVHSQKSDNFSIAVSNRVLNYSNFATSLQSKQVLKIFVYDPIPNVSH